MPIYTYKAINENGNTVSGSFEAEGPEKLTQMLGERGLIPVHYRETKETRKNSLWTALQERLSPVKMTDLILFTKQFRTMLRAGISVVRLFQVLESQTDHPRLKKIIAEMTMDIKGGLSLHEAFERHPSVFSTLYCSMVRAGESSGALTNVLDRLIYIVEHEHKIRSDIKAALRYPMIVLIALVFAFLFLLTFVIPKFVGIFLHAGLVLPLPTRISMLMYEMLSRYWLATATVAAGGGTGIFFYLKTSGGRFFKDSLMLRLPIIGPLFIKAAMSRFASIFAILQSSGVYIMETINILTSTIGNTAISRGLEDVKDKLEEGRGISVPLRTARYFTPMVINMVAIGEESGKLDELLQEVSAHYDDEVDYAMKQLSESIGPILTIGLAAVVGFFALSIFLPMWDLTKMAR